jgi:putative transcriptional regulator
MAIFVKLDDLLHERRMTLTELAAKVDITLANLSILKTGKARAIRFSTLEAICSALDCQLGDLLEFGLVLRDGAIEGAFAYAVVSGTLSVTMNGQTVVRTGTLAFTFTNRGGAWKIDAQAWGRTS